MPKVIHENKNIIIINNPGIPFFYFLMLYTLCTKNLLNVLFVEDIHPLSGLCVIPFRLDIVAT